jgi:hypothetical protein
MENVMAPKNPPLKLATAIVKKRQEEATPDENGGVNDEQKRPPKQQPLTKEEIRGWIKQLHAELSGGTTVKVSHRLCEELALTAAERLGLVVSGIQPGTVPQVVMSSITILKGAGVISKSDVGVTAETTE